MNAIVRHRLARTVAACPRRPAGPAILLSLILPAIAAAQPAAAPDAAAAGSTNLWQLLQQGGWAMWPLGLCLFAAIALTIHAARETRHRRFLPEPILPGLEAALGHRDLEAAHQLLAAGDTVLARVLGAGLARARIELPDANKNAIETSASEAIEHEEALVGQWIHYLNVVATIAPMVGLLGTVSGMIGAFQTISAGGMGRPELLAGDIGEALITTAAGLVIGIPAMVAYFVLRNRLGNRIIATARTATHLIDVFADASPPPPATQPGGSKQTPAASPGKDPRREDF